MSALENETILLIAYNEWDYRRTSHDWAYELAKRNTVVFVEGFPRYPEWKHGRRMAYWRRFLRRPVRRISERLILVSPPPMLPFSLPLASHLWPNAIARRSIKLSKSIHARALRRALHNLGLSPSVYIYHEPFDLLMIGCFGERANCYITYDEVSYFWINETAASAIEEIEAEHIWKAHAVLASSTTQCEKRKALNPNTHFVPHGVNFGLFSQAVSSKLPLPQDMESIPPPRIGFVGIVDKRVDVGLLHYCATRRPDWSFVMIGPIWDNIRPQLAQFELPNNVYFLGEKSPSELPAYLQYLDIATMPYLLDPRIHTTFPVKIFEYLAAGKPIVSTDLQGIRGMNDMIHFTKSPDAFITAIEDEMATDSPEKARVRIELARRNDWSARVEEMGRLLEPRLARR